MRVRRGRGGETDRRTDGVLVGLNPYVVLGSAVVGLLVGLTGAGGGALMTPMPRARRRFLLVMMIVLPDFRPTRCAQANELISTPRTAPRCSRLLIRQGER